MIKSKKAPGIFAPFSDVTHRRLILISAGEASADVHGANLVKAMARLRPDCAFWGIGGSRMAQAGVRILVSASDLAVVGLTEVLRRVRALVRAARTMASVMNRFHPDLLILLDYPDFNLFLARIAKRLGIPVFYYISPQVWAWRGGRVKKIARRVDRMAVILPFEESFYRKRGLQVTYVGHPLLDEWGGTVGSRLIPAHSMESVLQDPIVALLPGSRREEVRNLLPAMVRSVEIMRARYPLIRCVLPLAKTLSRDYVEGFLGDTSLAIDIRQDDIYQALSDCHAAVVASGTATLDTAIMEVPMVVVYKVAPVSYWFGRRLIRVPFISLVNLIAGEPVVPELIQGEVTPERIAGELVPLLSDREVRNGMIQKLRRIREALGEGTASLKAAEIALEVMDATGRNPNGKNHPGR